LGEQVYGPEHAERLVRLLRALAAGPQLLKLIGDVRSELFHYEVRSTYDTPEIAEHRRLVDEARQGDELQNLDEREDEEPWRDR